MSVTIRISKSFKRLAKPLLKKYPSLKHELQELQKTLEYNPTFGKPIGHNAFKIRLAVKSKGKGKSGGLRVISYLEAELIGIVDKKAVYLISIYDKSQTANISDKEIRSLIEKIEII